MKTSELIFVGIKGFVIALDRATGQQAWATRLKGADFVNVVIQNGDLLASCYGEIFRLDPFTGRLLWQNPLKGFGRGLATIAVQEDVAGGGMAVLAEKRRRDEQDAAAAASTAAM